MIEAVEIGGGLIRLQRPNTSTFPTYLGTLTIAEALALSRQLHAVAQAATWTLWENARGEVADLIDKAGPSGPTAYDLAMLVQRVETLEERLAALDRKRRK